MTEFPGYAAAQREWENREPPEPEASECETCHGVGFVAGPSGSGEDDTRCTDCDGKGAIGANGKPFDPHKAERDACDRADIQRDEQLMRDRDCDPPEDYGDF